MDINTFAAVFMGGARPGGFCQQYKTVYDAMTNKPSSSVAEAQNTMVKALVDAGVWSKKDIFYLLAAHSNDGGEAFINWINPGTYDITQGGAAQTFTVNEGFTGLGTGYLNTNFNPSTNGDNYTLNDSCIGVDVRNNVAENKKVYGAEVGTTAVYLYPRYATDNLYYKHNSATQEGVSSTDSIGNYVINRPASNKQDVYKNGSKIKDGVGVSTSLPNNKIYLLCSNDDGSPALYSILQIGLFFAGASLTTDEISAIHNAYTTYLSGL